MKDKPKISKIDLTRMVNEEAKKRVNINRDRGDHTTFNDYKKIVRIELLNKYEII